MPLASVPVVSIRHPSDTAVQSPVPWPPDESNDQDRIWPTCGSQPMIWTPEEITAAPLRMLYSRWMNFLSATQKRLVRVKIPSDFLSQVPISH